MAAEGEALLAELGARLSVRVQPLAVAELFAASPLLALPPAQQAQCLPAVGAALRRESL